MFVDTHVHLDDAKFDEDRPELLGRARAAGVTLMVSIGTALDDSRWACEYATRQEGVYASVGVHPERVETWRDEDLPVFRELCKRPKVRAVGEVGLDYHSPGFEAPAQEALFRQMIRLSLEAKLPLVIHQRDAAGDTLRVLREEGAGSEGGVFHCFAGDWETAQGAIALGFDIAVGGILTFPNAQALRAVIAQVPLERLVLETDAPWLAPQAQRGKRNEPAYMISVAERLASLKGLSLKEVEDATTRNARRIFRIQD
jgi:TatD DNase family protein